MAKKDTIILGEWDVGVIREALHNQKGRELAGYDRMSIYAKIGAEDRVKIIDNILRKLYDTKKLKKVL